MPIEQAVFSSARTATREGYQVVAASAGASPTDLGQLTVCCPTHDSLAPGRSPAGSVNYWPLASGSRCISRTTPSGGEYSGRGGPNIETRCLLVPNEVWYRFGANAFVVLRAAEAAGRFPRVSAVPGGEQSRLASFELPGRAALVDRMLLGQIAARREALVLALVLDALLRTPPQTGHSVAVAGAAAPELMCAAVVNCLPLEMRSALSFSTALVPSRQRPLRLVFVEAPYDHAHTLIDVSRIGAEVLAALTYGGAHGQQRLGGWARLVYRSLTGRSVGRVAAELERLPADASPEVLNGCDRG